MVEHNLGQIHPTNRPDIKFRVLVSHISMYTITKAQTEPLPLALLLEPYICQYHVDAFVVGHSHLTEVYNRTSVCSELGYLDHSFYAVVLGTSGGHQSESLICYGENFGGRLWKPHL